MLFPVLVAAGSVALGAVLAAVPGARRALGPVRVVVLALALGVALVSLTPAAWRALGPVSLVGVLAGLLVPSLAERAAGLALRSAPGRTASAVSFAGLLAHQLGDGMGLYAVQASVEAALALAAHTVPISAVVVLDALRVGAPRVAALRALLLALATVGGVVLGGAVPSAWVTRVEPWIAAVVAGLLVHVVVHEARRASPHP
jgi:zinc transporter ZupT